MSNEILALYVLFGLLVILFLIYRSKQKKENKSLMFQLESLQYDVKKNKTDAANKICSIIGKMDSGTVIDANRDKIKTIFYEELGKTSIQSREDAAKYEKEKSKSNSTSTSDSQEKSPFDSRIIIKTNNIRHDIGENSIYFGHWRVKNHTDPEQVKRISSGLKISKDNIMHFDPMNQTMKIAGSTGECYEVTLDSCTCPDFKRRRKPCKHIYRLAYECGYLDTLPKFKKENSSFNYEAEIKKYRQMYESGNIDMDTYVKLCNALKNTK